MGQYDPLSEEELTSPLLLEEVPSQYLYTPLQAHLDPVAALTQYGFSFVRYRARGYDFRAQAVELNGIDLGDAFSGNKPWSLLRLLYDSPHGPLRYRGLTPGSTTLGGLNGVQEYTLGAGERPAGGSLGVMFTDRRFRGGTRLNLGSGWLKHGWAGALTASGRWGRDAHIQGVFADDLSAMLSLDKRWAQKHTLSLNALFTNTEQGMRGASTHEAFDLTGDPLYNPYWGWQEDKERNARVRTGRDLLLLATWRYTPSDRFSATASFSFLAARDAYQGLDRYDASTPYPDYYRYMPSFFGDPQVSGPVGEAWRSRDPRVTQIDWQRLYEANRAAGAAALYAVGSDVTDRLYFQGAASFSYRSPEHFRLRGGLRARVERENNYRRLEDALGAQYVANIDQFLIDDEYFGESLENDLRNPGRKVQPGDPYDYDYDLFHRQYGGWLRVETDSPGRLSAFAGAEAAWRSYSREGFYEKELFPGQASYGPSPWADFTDYMLKAGVSYAFSPSHRLGLELAYGNQAPLARNVFLSPDYQNRLIENLRCEELLSAELRYRLSWKWLDVSLSGYLTRSRGGAQVRSYYDDLAGAFANGVLSGVDQLYAGVELGLLFTLSPRWSLRLAGVLSQNQYISDPELTIYEDKSGTVIAQSLPVFLKGYHPGGSPQQLATGELRYAARGWMASLSVNWAGGRYVTLNPLRRTRRVCDLALAPEIADALRAQERLGDATTIDLFASKTFRLGKKQVLILSASVDNLANRRRIVYSGYEPWRISRTGTGVNRTIGPFDSRYLYAYGRTYYLTVNYRF